MKTIKKLLALAFMASALGSASAAGADIVVLMDASGTILPWFEEINNRILVDITRKFVREDDTFHLISFNSRVNLEIVQPIKTESDISRVVSRFMLLYPLGQNSDFLSGLQYTWQYVSSLDPQREKNIIVISDGIFNPPASSPYASYTPQQVKDEIGRIAHQIRGSGWNVYYIKLPFPEHTEILTLDGNLYGEESASPRGNSGTASSSGKTAAAPAAGAATADGSPSSAGNVSYYDVSSEFSSSLDIEPSRLPAEDVPLTFIDTVFSMPAVTFPEDLGRQGRQFILPLKIENNSGNPLNMELTSVMLDDVDVLAETAFLNLGPGKRGTLKAELSLPSTVSSGPRDLPLSLRFSDNLRVIPQSATVHLTVTGFSLLSFLRTGGPVLFALILVCIACILVAFLYRFIWQHTSRPATVVRSTEEKGREQVNASPSAGQGRKPAAVTAAGAETIIETAPPARPAKPAAAIFGQPRPVILTGKNATAPDAGRTPAAGQTGTTTLPSPAEPSVKNSRLIAAQKTDKLIHFSTEKKELPVSILSGDPDAIRATEALAAEQAAGKKERLDILSAAASRIEKYRSSRAGADGHERIEIRGNRRTMLELSVDRQNTQIGKRNIHVMKAGTRLSIGGGSSAFLVFLVRFPQRIAELRYDGERCDLAILKPEFFPLETVNIIENCIGRDFVIVSDKGYEVTFRIRVYEDPVVELNRLLTSIRYQAPAQ